ncbi:MAG: flagellar export chaperone FliS [Magnetococcales bacterium]|nr:flagellar export chaperone FliS [Magnetococcales bacterium]
MTDNKEKVTKMNVQSYEAQSSEPVPSGLDILIQLYEGCISFLGEAAEACEAGQVENFNDRLLRARRIIEHFQETLDFEQGGPVPNQLNDLYTFMLDALTQADLTHETKYIQQVTDQLVVLLDGWRGAQPTSFDS